MRELTMLRVGLTLMLLAFPTLLVTAFAAAWTDFRLSHRWLAVPAAIAGLGIACLVASAVIEVWR
jgi:hypothetical protein